MADQWYRFAQGFLLVYSVTDRQSFFNLQRMHQDILRVKQKDAADIACLVVCNKVGGREALGASGEEGVRRGACEIDPRDA
jgi:GTPase SAR1 family protein